MEYYECQTAPPLGKWQAPCLNKSVSKREMDKLWALRSWFHKAAEHRRWEKLSKEKRDRVLNKCAEVLDNYNLPDYDLSYLSDDSISQFVPVFTDVDKVWLKLNEVLMRAAFPQVTSGRIPLEVRVHTWLKKNLGIKYIWLVQATLWHDSIWWGFEKWRDDECAKYLRWRADTFKDRWLKDFAEQRSLFAHFLKFYGYSDDECWSFAMEFFGDICAPDFMDTNGGRLYWE